ncbi:hypothetical protein [Vibrio nigripulchritudo]|uniref:hypothetical protein n=1 Tax=Vibrio nigripulchritudo TaxID=28173 RepID=UPI0024933D03|nr:hypothetical protein [Vibrio nigripulchritudo]BDU39493.1 hypothetical protein TUMSATVNIG2_39620 [Vibrio nigripulchritudo]BDU45214.1 hypothetical protein TUMSATVNIG3_40120 [Vibrio nigripulchritudo]
MKVFENQLEKFFSQPKNTTRREALLLNRLSYDFQLAAAFNNYYLKVYISDVDDNGYDVIIDSEMYTKKLQVKSVMVNSSTNAWYISKGLIKPSMENQRRLNAWSHIDISGIEGGVVVQQVRLENEIVHIKYFYTDIWLLTAMALGILGSEIQEKSAIKVLASLSGFDYHEKQRIPLSLFFESRDVESLLGVMGFRTRYDLSMHRYLMCERHTGSLGPREHIDKRIRQELFKFGEMYCYQNGNTGESR